MNIRTIPVSSPYNPVAFHILQRDDYSLEEFTEDIPILYTRDMASRSYVLTKRGGIPSSIMDVEEIRLPVIEVASYPLIKKDHINNLIKAYGSEEAAAMQIIERNKDSLRRQIDVEVFKTINAAVPNDHSISVVGTLHPENFLLALALLDEHDQPRGAIIMHQQRFKDLEGWDAEYGQGRHDFISANYEVDKANIGIDPPIWGYFKNIPIYVSTMVPKNAVYCLAKKHHVGRILVRQDMKVRRANYLVGEQPAELHGGTAAEPYGDFYTFYKTPEEISKIHAGWVVSMEFGVGVMNDYTISRILVNGGSSGGYNDNDTVAYHFYEEANLRAWKLEKELECAKKVITKAEEKVDKLEEKVRQFESLNCVPTDSVVLTFPPEPRMVRYGNVEAELIDISVDDSELIDLEEFMID